MNDDFIEITSDDGEVVKVRQDVLGGFLHCLGGLIIIFVCGAWALVEYLI